MPLRTWPEGTCRAEISVWIARLRAGALRAVTTAEARDRKGALQAFFAQGYRCAAFQATALTSTTMSGCGSPRTMTVVLAGPLLSK